MIVAVRFGYALWAVYGCITLLVGPGAAYWECDFCGWYTALSKRECDRCGM